MAKGLAHTCSPATATAVPANNLPPSPQTEEIPASALTCPAHPAFLPLPHAAMRHPVSLHKPVQTGDWNRCYQVIPGAGRMPPCSHGELVHPHILTRGASRSVTAGGKHPYAHLSAAISVQSGPLQPGTHHESRSKRPYLRTLENRTVRCLHRHPAQLAQSSRPRGADPGQQLQARTRNRHGHRHTLCVRALRHQLGIRERQEQYARRLVGHGPPFLIRIFDSYWRFIHGR